MYNDHLILPPVIAMKMARSRSTIMVAISAMDSSALPLLRKALQLARQRSASLELLHVIALPYGPVLGANTSVRQAVRDAVKEAEKKLEKLATSAKVRGLSVRKTVVWDYPASDAIVRQVLRRRPALLLAESQRHSRLSRVILSNTDWDLIRNCPCPLLLSKRSKWPKRPNVLAALDPFHAHAKPAALDDAILTHAVSIAGNGRRVRACHAHVMSQLLVIEGVHEPYWVTMPPSEQKAFDSRLRAALERETRRHAIPDANVLTVREAPENGLPRLAKKMRADVVIMGAVSRTGLKRLFIGNTAERVIDAIDADVLIVKPRGFRTAVNRRPARLMPFPPYPGM
jgi:universal stress protein E